MCLWCQILETIPSQAHEDLLLVFVSLFTVLGLVLSSMIHFEFIFLQDIRVQLHSFTCSSPVVPAPFVEMTIHSSLNYLGTVVQNQSTMPGFLNASAQKTQMSITLNYIC